VLLKKIPGANINTNGPLSGIPQYRGLFGARIATQINGMQLASAGPNWMDPPLSYATSGQLESLILYRGIAPVSVAQESIGAAVEVKTKEAQFDTGALQLEGSVIAKVQSVSDAQHVNGVVFVGNQTQQLKASALVEQGDDAEFSGGLVRPTEYERARFDLGYRMQQGVHTVELEYAYNDTGTTGTPALPMDIDYIEGDIYRATYKQNREGAAEIKLDVYGSELDHGMTNYLLRAAPGNPAMWRRNIASSDNLGVNFHASLPTQHGAWRVGLDYFAADHQSDIDNPNNAMFFVQNFNDVERDVLGVFVERLYQADNWRGEYGLRVNQVDMNAGQVDATPARMMPPATALRDQFNAANRERRDTNFDLVAKTWFSLGHDVELYLGSAQKMRSPSYQERYLWLPLQATAGLADGLSYTGNVELEPEVSREIELGVDVDTNRVSVSPRVFYKRVDDYIQGVAGRSEALMMVRMMNTVNGTNNPDPLQFGNVDAELYGFDVDWRYAVSDQLTVSGLINYVRGKRRDIDDNLYRIAPLNATTRLSYSSGDWTVDLESVVYANQDDVSVTNLEQETSGYGLINMHIAWQASSELDLSLGVNNVLDKRYQDHLSGYNRVRGGDIAVGERLPGYGVNMYASARYEF
jgi:iron complex outermembrane receptor protein